MGMDISTSFVVGVSFLPDGGSLDTLEEKGTIEFEGNTLEFGRYDNEYSLEIVASHFDVELALDMPRPEEIFDYLIGVVWSSRPSDNDVKEAKEKVAAVLPKLEAVLGKASSAVEEWTATSISV